MKRLATLLIVIALAVITAYSAVAFTSFTGGEYTVASAEEATPEKNVNRAELIYNYLRMSDGTILYSVQAYVNKEKLTYGLSGENLTLKNGEINAVMTKIKTRWEQNGYTITISEGDYVEANIKQYESLEDLYLSNGYDGYDVTASSAEAEWHLWTIDYVNKQDTVFADMEGSTIATAEEFLLEIDGVGAEDIVYIYNYGTTYSEKTLESTADSVRYDEKLGCYIHEFRMNAGNKDREITLVQHSPNSLTYYALVLVATCLAAGICILAFGGKKTKK